MLLASLPWTHEAARPFLVAGWGSVEQVRSIFQEGGWESESSMWKSKWGGTRSAQGYLDAFVFTDDAPSEETLQRPAWYFAIKFNTLEVVEYVVEEAEITPADEYCQGFYAIHAAASNPDPRVLQYLAHGGGVIGLKGADGTLPIHSAAASNPNAEVLEEMLKLGASPLAKTDAGLTPLHYAAFGNQNSKIIALLLSAGADPNSRSDDGSSPMHNASANNPSVEVLEALHSAGGDVSAPDDNGLSPLHRAAAQNKNPEICRALINWGADMARFSKDGFQAIHYAAITNGNERVAMTLVELGADVHTDDRSGDGAPWSALEWAVVNPKPTVVSALVEAGRPSVADLAMMLAHAAIYNRDPSVAEALIGHGANVNAAFVEEEGRTALHFAVASNPNPKVAEALIKMGADVNAVSDTGVSVLTHAVENGAGVEVLEMLRGMGACVSSIRFEDFRKICDERAPSEMTSLQEAEWAARKQERESALLGKRVCWSGWIGDVQQVEYPELYEGAPLSGSGTGMDVRAYMERIKGDRVTDESAYMAPVVSTSANGVWLGHGEYYCRIDMDSPEVTFSLPELSLKIDEGLAFSLSRGQRVWIQGVVLETGGADRILLEEGWKLFTEDPCRH